MKCKHCGAALEENATVCPACGEAVEHTAFANSEKKVTPKTVLTVALAAVLAVIVGALCFFGFNNWGEETVGETTGASVAATTDPSAPEETLSAADIEAVANADVVVATLGDKELINGMLQMYYGLQIWDMVEEYGSYLSYLGLDLTMPLDEQAFPYAEDTTWHQYFLEMALDAWMQQQALVCMAEEVNYQFPEDLQSYLDALPATLDEQAILYGYTSGEALVQAEMGANVSVEIYKAYIEIYNKGAEYYANLYGSVQFTPEEVEQYFDEHAEDMQTQYNVTKDTNPVIDVRHILLIPEETVDESGATVYTDESKAACLQEAEALLQQWSSGEATEESFAQLANEHSEDPGSNTTGGLYEFVYQGDMVETFDAWCFDETRKPGDTGIVETDYGYHIMYFVYGADEWYRAAQQELADSKCNEMVVAAVEQYGFEVDYEKISLCTIYFE